MTGSIVHLLIPFTRRTDKVESQKEGRNLHNPFSISELQYELQYDVTKGS